MIQGQIQRQFISLPVVITFLIFSSCADDPIHHELNHDGDLQRTSDMADYLELEYECCKGRADEAHCRRDDAPYYGDQQCSSDVYGCDENSEFLFGECVPYCDHLEDPVAYFNEHTDRGLFACASQCFSSSEYSPYRDAEIAPPEDLATESIECLAEKMHRNCINEHYDDCSFWSDLKSEPAGLSASSQEGINISEYSPTGFDLLNPIHFSSETSTSGTTELKVDWSESILFSGESRNCVYDPTQDHKIFCWGDVGTASNTLLIEEYNPTRGWYGDQDKLAEGIEIYLHREYDFEVTRGSTQSTSEGQFHCSMSPKPYVEDRYSMLSEDCTDALAEQIRMEVKRSPICWQSDARGALADNRYGQWGNELEITPSGSCAQVNLGSTYKRYISLDQVMGSILIYSPEIARPQSLALGTMHGCALLTSGSLRCWGWNRYGQVNPEGGSSSYSTPQAPQVPSEWMDH